MAYPIGLLETKASCVRKIQPLFKRLDSMFRRYAIDVQDRYTATRLSQQWFEYRTRPRSTYEVVTQMKARKIGKELWKLVEHLSSITHLLGPSDFRLAELQRMEEELGDEPDSPPPSREVVVEGEAGSFTISFMDAQTNISTGGFAYVYSGHDERNRKYALKRQKGSLADPDYADFERRIVREKDHWMSFKHKNILPLLGTCRISGFLFLVSPFMDNGTLFNYVVGSPNADVARLVYEVAAAIEYLHQQEFVHGDIKGSNVLISDDYHALLGDFGMTKPSWSSTSGGVKGDGTLPYKAPELESLDSTKAKSSDMYAFGITIASVLTREENPYPNASYGWGIAAMILKGSRPVRPDQSPSFGELEAAVWGVAERCWVADPRARISSTEASELLADINAAR